MSPNSTSSVSPLGTCAPVVEMNDAVVKRGGKEILHIDEFALHAGEQLVLLGPNGAGKSTFVQLLTREIMPLWRNTPAVKLCGETQMLLTDIKHLVGVVSTSMQEQIRVNLTPREVVVGGLLGALGVPPHMTVTPHMYEQADEALAKLGLAEFAQRDMRTLSTGEARKVLIARALVNSPQILVLDEPCAGLGPEAAYVVRQAYRQLAEGGATLILVTHHVEDIVPPMTRVAVIKGGTIIADGPLATTLTTQLFQDTFGVPLVLEHRGGEYRLWQEK